MQNVRFALAALRNVWGKCSTSPGTLRSALQAQRDAQFLSVSQGGIKTVSINGRMTSFADSGSGQFTPTEILEMWVYLVELYDRAVNDLGQGKTDLVIETQMETYLRPITSYTDNYMYLAK